MKHLRSRLLVVCVATPTICGIATGASVGEAQRGVFVMTNNAIRNEVITYERTAYGTLQDPHDYRPGGRGSGGKVDPLASQGSLSLSREGEWLFAVNAGSATLSAFHVQGALRSSVPIAAPADPLPCNDSASRCLGSIGLYTIVWAGAKSF